jgi:Protein of unknown function (DUF3108)
MAERMNVLAAPRLTGRRRAAWLLLVAIVLLLHADVMRRVGERIQDFKLAQQSPKRIEVAYVQELALEQPAPVAAPAPVVAPPPPPRARAARPARAASAPLAADPPTAAAAPLPAPAASEPLPEPPRAQIPEPAAAPAPAPLAGDAEALASAPPPEPVAPAAAPEPAPAPGAPAPKGSSTDVAAGAKPFDWPNSTRISYALTGNYRGEVQGSAQVEWIRAAARYQVHLDIVIGPSMAPLITRRMSSDGDLTPEGLSPRRYDEETKAAFRDRRRVTMLFEPDTVVMASGQRRERWPGVQDTASQFVQLTYLFTTRPELLRVGQNFEVPLALPRNIDRWVYDVVKEETLYTSFGEVPSFHVKPRRVTRPGGELSIEIWFSPQLRYLPVRIRIEQDPETFLDLVLDRRPQIAVP